jgi:hypothetical protein
LVYNAAKRHETPIRRKMHVVDVWIPVSTRYWRSQAGQIGDSLDSVANYLLGQRIELTIATQMIDIVCRVAVRYVGQVLSLLILREQAVRRKKGMLLYGGPIEFMLTI